MEMNFGEVFAKNNWDNKIGYEYFVSVVL